MLAFLKGVLEEARTQSVILDVGGVGYEITVPVSLMPKLPPKGEMVKLYTFLIVREGAWELYGFSSLDERNLFRRLISVSGIGPKVAITLLSTLAPDQLVLAIDNGDIETLSLVPGVGKKTAQRLVLELKGKIEREILVEDNFSGPGNTAEEVIQALQALGYSATEAREAVNEIDDLSQDITTLVRKALKNLDKQRK